MCPLFEKKHNVKVKAGVIIKGQKRIKIFQSANSTYNDWWSPHVVEHCQTTFFTQMQPKNRFTSRKGTFHVVNLCPRTLIYFTTIRAIKKSSRVNPQLLRSFFINNAPCSSRFYLQPINRRNFRPQLDMCRGLRFEINVLIRRKHPDWIKKCEDFVIEHHWANWSHKRAMRANLRGTVRNSANLQMSRRRLPLNNVVHS